MMDSAHRTPIKGVIFDKDGTLFDFNATWGPSTGAILVAETADNPAALGPLADALGYDLETGTFRPESLVIASTAHEVIEATLPFVSETSASALLDRFTAATADVPQVAVTDLVAFVRTLRNAGLKLGIATNDAEAPARANLASAQIEHVFDFIAGFDSGFGGKPAPGQLLGFCAAMDLTPAECVMVGDSTHDLHAGRAAGMTCVGVLTGVASRTDLTPHADVVLGTIAELPAWLGI